MSSVEWGSSSELTTGGDRRRSRWTREITARLDKLSDVQARRVAAAGLMATFVLVVVAQWQPWFTLDTSGANNGFDLPSTGVRSIGALNALNALVDPYYLGWTLIGIVAAVAVLGRRRFRRTAAAIAAAALAGQALVVLAVWHDNGVGMFRSVLGDAGGVRGHRESGIYFAVAAVVLAAASMVIAVRGHILPSFRDDVDDDAARQDDQQPAAAAVPAAAIEDDDFEVTRPRLGAPSVERTEPLGDERRNDDLGGQKPAAPVDQPDHAMFMRPQGIDARR